MGDPSHHNRRAVPQASSTQARRRMQATRQHGTAAEKLVCNKLDELGLEYEVNRSPIPGLRSRADIVFNTARIAVFIDGCFWHSCPIHATAPKSNSEWWREKLNANRQRDERTNQALAKAGWLVLRFWEHDDPAKAAIVVAEHVSARLGTVVEPHQ